jgi:hypothetical protein
MIRQGHHTLRGESYIILSGRVQADAGRAGASGDVVDRIPHIDGHMLELCGGQPSDMLELS